SFNDIKLLNGSATTIDIQINHADGDKMTMTMVNLANAMGSISLGTISVGEATISNIDAAIDNISAARAQLGAYQNRLEHTVNNLGTTSENLSAAESRIRDTDMAKEMVALS